MKYAQKGGGQRGRIATQLSADFTPKEQNTNKVIDVGLALWNIDGTQGAAAMLLNGAKDRIARMNQVLISLLFAALAIAAIRTLAYELSRPLHQPWLDNRFDGLATDAAHQPVDFTDRRLRRDILIRAQLSQQPCHAVAA